MLSTPPFCGQSAVAGSDRVRLSASHDSARTRSKRTLRAVVPSWSTVLDPLGTGRTPGGLLLLQRRELLVADVVEIEPADVHLVDRPIAPADERGRIGVLFVRRGVVVVRDRMEHR